MTPERRARLKEGWKTIAWGVGIGSLYAGFLAVDLLGTPIEPLEGKVVRAEHVKRRYGERCAVTVATAQGEIVAETPLPCSYSSTGMADVRIMTRTGRLTGSVRAMYNSIEPMFYIGFSRPRASSSGSLDRVPFSADKNHPFELP